MQKRDWAPVIAVVLGILVGLILILSRRPSETPTLVTSEPAPVAVTAPEPPKPKPPTPSPGAGTPVGGHGNSGSIVPDTPRTTSTVSSAAAAAAAFDLEKRLAERRAEAEAARQKAIEQTREYLLKEMERPDLPERTREVYRLRLIPELRTAHEALLQRDWKTAFENFQKANENKLASPLTRHVTCDYLIDLAAKMGDQDLYIKAMKEQAKIEAEHDIPILGVEKSDRKMKWIEDRERYLRANKDPAMVSKLFAEIKQNADTELTDAEINDTVQRRMGLMKEIFDTQARTTSVKGAGE